jgi:hypothetical protein
MKQSLFICFLISLPFHALANEESTTPIGGDYSERWTGVYYGTSALTGVHINTNRGFDNTLGLSYGANMRISLALQLLDLHLSYFHSTASPQVDGVGAQLNSDSFSFSGGIHPFFLSAFTSPRMGYFLSSIYLLLGTGFESTEIQYMDVVTPQEWRLGFHTGGGFDYPITSPQQRHAIWFGGQYRFNYVPTEFAPVLAHNQEALRQHLFFLTLSYRINGLPF